MDKLSNEKMVEISGGGKTLAFGLLAAGIFIVGVVDGIIRPYKCRK